MTDLPYPLEAAQYKLALAIDFLMEEQTIKGYINAMEAYKMLTEYIQKLKSGGPSK